MGMDMGMSMPMHMSMPMEMVFFNSHRFTLFFNSYDINQMEHRQRR